MEIVDATDLYFDGTRAHGSYTFLRCLCRLISSWYTLYYIIILKLQLCVCVREREREVTGSRLTATQKVLFFCKATAGCYIRDPTNTASKSASSRLKKALLQSVVQKLDREVDLHVAA